MLHRIKIGLVDKLGATMAVICALHCLALPVLLPFLGSIIGNPFIEVFFLASAIVLAVYALYNSHKDSSIERKTFILFVSGISLLFISIFWHNHTFSGIGGIAVATAHYWNFKNIHASCEH